MKHQEAIRILSNMIHDDKAVYGNKPKLRNEALELAIKALEQSLEDDAKRESLKPTKDFIAVIADIVGFDMSVLIDSLPEFKEDEELICSNCAYYGEKAVTGHCIKCRDKDMWEARKSK